MLQKGSLKGMYIPIITPMKYGEFDEVSMGKLIDSVDEYVDGYVPCLSSGEGAFLTKELWVKVTSFVRSKTTKPVIAGIKRKTQEEIIELVKIAEKIGCDAYIIPVPSSDFKKTKEHIESLLQKTSLPMVIYNTETEHICRIEDMKEIDAIERVIAIKDSSMKEDFFVQMCDAQLKGELHMSVLQGMEHQLDVSNGCDGYLVSLLNTEPLLVREYFKNRDTTLEKELFDKFMKYNLGSEWFVTLKALLFSKGVIDSAEQVKQFIELPDATLKSLRQDG